MCLVMALLGFKFNLKNKNREAVPNVVIVKPCIDDEHRTNKRSTGMLLFDSHIVMSRGRGKVAVYNYYLFLYQG